MRFFVDWSGAPLLVMGGLLFLVGCGPKNTYQDPPPPKVIVASPVKQTVTNYLEETATTEAVERVEIQARVEGFLESINFTPGAVVQAGDVLYRIEPDLYAARVASAKADLLAQEALRKKAEIEKDRQRRMRERDPGSTSEVAVVAAQAEFDGADAAVKQAEAMLKQAELDLAYTEVVAPISGRVGKTLVKQGNLVGSGGQATPLTTVIQYDPIWANFNISERELLRLQAKEHANGTQDANREKIPIYLRRANDDDFRFKGHFDYADFAVDQSTGTFLIRGVFPNPDHLILPGLFVRVRLPVGKNENALLVPERSLGFDQSGQFLLIVNDQDEVERRDVTMGSKFKGMVVIEEGLHENDLVVIDGLQRSRPGAKVSPKKVTLKADGETQEGVQSGATESPPVAHPDAASPDHSANQEPSIQEPAHGKEASDSPGAS